MPAAADERVVVSVIADPEPGGHGWRLRHATCLVVPAACAQTSWRAWAAYQTDEPARGAAKAELPATFRIDGAGWLLAREVPELEDARSWLAQVFSVEAGSGGDVVIPELGSIPTLRAHLTAPSTVVRAMLLGPGGCGNLLSGAVRPAAGAIWRGARQAFAVELPRHLDVGESFTSWPSHDLAGIHVTPAGVAEDLQTPEGLFVGRMERRAWLVDQRGTRAGDHKLARLGWDAAQVDASGLVLQVEEFDDDGELVLSQRVACADLNLPVASSTPVEVRLPTLGPKLRHGLSLYAADGGLLDRIDPGPFAETVSLSLSFGDSEPLEVTSGTPLTVPALEERLGRARAASEEFTTVRRSGADARILDHATRPARLRALLERARGELLVADPYFGQEETDWELLRDLEVPVRVLTCKIAGAPAPIPAGVQARIRPKGTKVIHDRAYIWSDGGFMLGGSPSVRPDIGVMPLSPAEAAVRTTTFEALWQSEHFRVLERR